MITMEPMRWWHIEQAMVLEHELFGSTAWSAAQMWSELAREQRRYYVIVTRDEAEPGADQAAAGDVIGYAGINLLPPDADVQTVAVAPRFQGQGLARRLVDRLIADASEAGCAQIMLEVRAENDAALRLYENFGFEVIARRTSYYGPGADALIMRLRPLRDATVSAS